MNIQQINELRSKHDKNDYNQFKYKHKHSNGLPTLYHLTINLIKRNLSQINDIGLIPYHLLEPILVKMSSKQLSSLEEKSNQLMPYSDKIWKSLILKDFPNRPIEIKQLNKKKTMPYKSLYYKYVKEREEYRKDSTKRLKKLNDSLMQEKARNKVIAVDDVLKDPTIKKRFDYGSNRNYRHATLPNKNTILGKARRETQSRSLIFGRQKSYDPCAAFKKISQPTQIQPPRNHIHTKFTYQKPQPIPKASEVKPSIKKPTNEVKKISTIRPQTASPPPSIFIQRKRTLPNKSPEPKKKKEKIDESPSEIKPLKSSIFS
ncbi:unnamed protein product [Candida verbasci]|uniref:Elongin-A n=1 Tax=Candida verbasci TaxID=1227364 RepID=A0A9W4TWH2_9ASCO|nr:unnamed protein product [Candida verbasci]